MVCVGTLKSNCSLTPTVSLFFNSTPLPFPVILHAVSSITTLYVSFGHLIHAVVLYLTLPILVLPLPLLFLHLLSHRLELNGSQVDTHSERAASGNYISTGTERTEFSTIVAPRQVRAIAGQNVHGAYLWK
jgi:hypothetical protein